MKKYIFEVSLLIGLCFSLLIGASAKEEQVNISEKLIRLHIIANSDYEADQKLKLAVRDSVLDYMNSLTESCEDRESAEKAIRAHLRDFEAIADEVCRDFGASYSARAEMSESSFPTKHYDGFSLPAGKYTALKIKLGKASGQNWWCVLFPPLCVSAAEVNEGLEKSGLSDSEISLVTSEKPKYKLKFKILELIEKIAN